jgi:cytochrome c556
MRRSILIAASLLAVLSVAAQAADTKPEELLKARQGSFQTLKLQFMPIVAVAKGDAALSPDTAVRAANLVALAQILPTTFAKGSEALPKSDTKAEAFTKVEFLQGFDTLAIEAAKLEVAAKAGNVDGVKAGVGAVGKACKACHETFRNE